ncbi:MAG: flagellar basal body-associated FliL family protein [Aliarcobacter sp.]|nr:flagellar basal body-associated FliL family protein [Aliarcobacter sp.]
MADDNQEKSSGGGKGLMIVLIALVVILILAVIGGGFFLYSQGSLGGNNSQPTQEEVKKDESSEKTDSFKADINDLVLNLTDSRGKEKLMKLSFSIKSNEPTIAALVEEYKAEIIDVVISQISSRSSEELLTVGGKNLLKDELMQDINNVINEVTKTKSDVAKNNVKQILFTTFVIK